MKRWHHPWWHVMQKFYTKMLGHPKHYRKLQKNLWPQRNQQVSAGLASPSNTEQRGVKGAVQRMKASHWIKMELWPHRKHLIFILFFVFTPVDTSLSKLHQEIVQDGEAWHAAVYRVSKSQTRFSNWTTMIAIKWITVQKIKGNSSSKEPKLRMGTF